MKKLLSFVIFLIIGVVVSFAETMKRSVTYNISPVGEITITGLEPIGSVARFKNSYGKSIQMTAQNTSTLSVSNYEGYIIKGLTLHMYSNSRSGAGTFYFKIGNNKIAEISDDTKFNSWFGNKEWANASAPAAIDVTFNGTYAEGYRVEIGEDLEIAITATENSLYIVGYTIIYQKAEDVVDIPRITPTKGDVFYRKQQINISCEADVDAIYFTTDGTEPTTTSQKYNENVPLYIDKETTIKAFAIKDNEPTKASTKTFIKDNIKAIVAEYNNQYFAMIKTLTKKHLGAKNVIAYDNFVLCNSKDFMTYAWRFNEDGTIQDYEKFKYLNNKTDSSNPAETTAEGTQQMVWDITDNGMVVTSDNVRYLCYNPSEYFGAYTLSAKNDYVAYPMDLVKGYVRVGLASGKIGTICLPYDVLNDDRMGATFYNIAGKKTDENNNVISLILEEETGTLIAGRPYLFEATDDALCCMYLDFADDSNAAEAGSYNGLYGSMKETPVTEGMYLISDNKVVKCGKGCSIAANRAFIDMEEVKELNETQHLFEHMLTISIVEGNSTNIKTAERENTNNTLIYNMQGQRVVVPAKGVYIVNGKKTIIK